MSENKLSSTELLRDRVAVLEAENEKFRDELRRVRDRLGEASESSYCGRFLPGECGSLARHINKVLEGSGRERN